MNSRFTLTVMLIAASAAISACATTPTPAPVVAAVPVAPVKGSTATAKPMKSAYGNYTRVVRNGQAMYCQQDKDTGTRMVHEVCLTEEQMREQQEHARNFMQDAQIAAPPIAGPNVR